MKRYLYFVYSFFYKFLIVARTTEFNYETMFSETSFNMTLAEKTKLCDGGTLSAGCFTPRYVSDVFFFSCLIFIGTFSISMSLKMFRNTRFFPNKVSAMHLLYSSVECETKRWQ